MSVKVHIVEVAKRANIYHRIQPYLVTSRSVVWCKRTGVSHLVVKFHILYRCGLVRLTPYACSPAIDDSVLTIAVRECIVSSVQSVLFVRYWGWMLLQYFVGSL